MHFISDCSYFENERLEYHNSITKTWEPLPIPQEILLDPVFLFGGKSPKLNPNELKRRCGETKAKIGTIRHTAKFLHVIKTSLDRFAKT